MKSGWIANFQEVEFGHRKECSKVTDRSLLEELGVGTRHTFVGEVGRFGESQTGKTTLLITNLKHGLTMQSLCEHVWVEIDYKPHCLHQKGNRIVFEATIDTYLKSPKHSETTIEDLTLVRLGKIRKHNKDFEAKRLKKLELAKSQNKKTRVIEIFQSSPEHRVSQIFAKKKAV